MEGMKKKALNRVLVVCFGVLLAAGVIINISLTVKVKKTEAEM